MAGWLVVRVDGWRGVQHISRMPAWACGAHSHPAPAPSDLSNSRSRPHTRPPPPFRRLSCRVWDLDEDGEELQVLEGHGGWVVSAAFVGTTHRLVTASHVSTQQHGAGAVGPWAGRGWDGAVGGAQGNESTGAGIWCSN